MAGATNKAHNSGPKDELEPVSSDTLIEPAAQVRNYRLRAVGMGLLCLCMSSYAITCQECPRWNLATGGLLKSAVMQPFSRHYFRPEFGTPYAVASASASLLVLLSAFGDQPNLSLPAIALVSGDMLVDLADSLVSAFFLLRYYSTVRALLHATLTALFLGLELFLWIGAVRFNEEMNSRRRDQLVQHPSSTQ